MLWIALDRIRPNPWQTRDRYDPAYVAELAADIRARADSRPETKGLLQVPAGRVLAPDNPFRLLDLSEAQVQHRVDMGELVVQLVYGHHRLAAFRSLAAEAEYYGSLPVDLVWFDDQEMATAAWAENYQRRNMTPLEEAQALALMMEDFGWTQKQAGERLHLAQSTVANKLRLLRLPVEVRSQVQEGALSERQAMAVAPLAELPAAAVQGLPEWRRSDLEKTLAEAGRYTSDELRERTERVVEQATRDLEKAVFAEDWPLPLPAPSVRAEMCTACDHRLRGGRCADPACFEARTLAWKQGILARAAEAMGIPALDPQESEKLGYGNSREFYDYNEDNVTALERARAEPCENLRLAWKKPWSGDVLGPEAFPDLRWVCAHGKGKQCRCQQGITKEREQAGQAAARAQKQALRVLKGETLEAFAAALDAGETGALRALLVQVGAWKEKQENREISDRNRIVHKLAKLVVGEVCDWSFTTPEKARDKVAEWRQQMGLDGDGPEASPLEDVRQRVARIARWIETLDQTLPTPEMVQGNLDNLERLALDLDGAVGEEGDVLREAIALDQGVLKMMLPAVRGWDGVGFDHVFWLVHTTPEDINFKTRLQEASGPVVRYALALVAGQEGHKTRTDALHRRLRALTAEENGG